MQSRHVAAWPLGTIAATQINAVAIRETCFEDGSGQPGDFEDLIVIDVNSRSTEVLVNGVDVTASLQTFNARVTSSVCGGSVRRTNAFPIGNERQAFEVHLPAPVVGAGPARRNADSRRAPRATVFRCAPPLVPSSTFKPFHTPGRCTSQFRTWPYVVCGTVGGGLSRTQLTGASRGAATASANVLRALAWPVGNLGR